MSRSVTLDPISGLFVLTDRESGDVDDLYDGDIGVTAGTSSLVVRLASTKGLTDTFPRGTATVAVAATGSSFAAPLSRIWSGQLFLLSGSLLLSEWSMEPLERIDVPPGSYYAAVWADFGGDPVPLHVTLRPTGLP